MEFPGGLLIDRQFTSLEEHSEWCKGWDFASRKLDLSSYLARYTAIITDEVHLSNQYFESIVEIEGSTPEGFITFAIPADEKHRLTWYHKDLDQGFITKFPSSREVDAVSKGYFHNRLLSIREDVFHRLIDDFKLQNLRKMLKPGDQIFNLPQIQIWNISRDMLALLREAIDHQRALSDPNFIYRLKHVLPFSLLELLNYSGSSWVPSQKKSKAALEHSLGIIRQNIQGPISVRHLAEEVSVSQKTLETEFKKRYQLTPHQYIKRTKLNLIRYQLLDNGHKPIINDLLKNYGFQNAGQFAADYSRFFNELPSHTLRNQQEAFQ